MWRLEKDVMEQEAAPEQLEIKNRLNYQEEKMGEMFQQLQSVRHSGGDEGQCTCAAKKKIV